MALPERTAGLAWESATEESGGASEPACRQPKHYVRTAGKYHLRHPGLGAINASTKCVNY